ncbi:carbohydrate kinase family protein [Ponticaulis profundi]|uniref:Carbohydrate kinase family protein n=1 Tax=Ponticaulis profundi TaxID=2665222 RepID=A0ABW1S827_9PROT
MTDLVCIGLTTLDILGRPVRELPKGGATAWIDEIALAPAGTAGGCAVVASRLGLKTQLASLTGEDRIGRVLRQLFEEEGVGVEHLKTTSDLPTSTTILLIQQDGERPNLHMLGASVLSDFTPDSIDCAKTASYLHFGGVGFPNLTTTKTLNALTDIRESGTRITCDLISPQPETLDFLKKLLPLVDVFMPSLAEAEALLGTQDPESAARTFVELGAGACIVKVGGEGSVGYADGNIIHCPARKIDVVDTTSCGDSYCAGFIAGRCKGQDFETAMQTATLTASLVAQGTGTLGKLETYEQIEGLRTL